MRYLLLFISIFLSSCAYYDSFSQTYEPVDGGFFNEKHIESLQVSLRMHATYYHDDPDGFFRKSRVMEPYYLEVRISDRAVPHDMVNFHSMIIENQTHNEVITLFTEKDGHLTLPFSERINLRGDVSWGVEHFWRQKPFAPIFSVNQNLKVTIEFSIISGDNIRKEKLVFLFKATSDKYKRVLPLIAA